MGEKMIKKKRLCIFIVVLFLFSIGVPTVLAATEEELEIQKEAANEELEASQYQVDLTQNTIEGIETEIAKAEAEVRNLTKQVSELLDKIRQLESELETAEQELEKIELQRDQQKSEMEERLRVMYMYGNEGYVEVLFSSENFADFITKVDIIASIARADQDLYNDLVVMEEDIREKKLGIETNKAETEAAKAEVDVAIAAQEDIKAQQDQLLAQNQEILAAFQAEMEVHSAEIAQIESELAEIAREKALEEGLAPDYGSSSESSNGYIWPTPTSYLITDYFGPRESPGGIGSTNHMGLDIGASYGEPIVAVASGVVTLARYYGGFGNSVMIAHDTGMITISAHMSQINVYDGEYVSQGEVIGYVGSTGNSTGPHLHIGFMDSGWNYTDPLNYLPY